MNATRSPGASLNSRELPLAHLVGDRILGQVAQHSQRLSNAFVERLGLSAVGDEPDRTSLLQHIRQVPRSFLHRGVGGGPQYHTPLGRCRLQRRSATAGGGRFRHTPQLQLRLPPDRLQIRTTTAANSSSETTVGTRSTRGPPRPRVQHRRERPLR